MLQQPEHAHRRCAQHLICNRLQALLQHLSQCLGVGCILLEGRLEGIGPAAHRLRYQLVAIGGEAVEGLLGNPRLFGHRIHGRRAVAPLEQQGQRRLGEGGAKVGFRGDRTAS
ncbi:hypothetical protein KAM329D_29030 [Aeromonas caviae]|nr:hypothetical protein KAM329_010330 [Aeromonas caviae]GJC23922.1 hypothetical protein KAM329D_29030 [Aeromonas caviae]GKR05719.1 hypothetical protein KAM463_12840 [Aeromonas caviae]